MDMNVVVMDKASLKLYTVPQTLQPMRPGPLTMSGVGMAKTGEERRGTSSGRSRVSSATTSKVRPGSAITLYYMQKPYVAIAKPEQIALSSLNITPSRKLTLRQATNPNESSSQTVPRKSDDITRSTEGSTRAYTLPNGQVKIKSTENGQYPLPKRPNSRKEEENFSDEKLSKPNSSDYESEIFHPRVKYPRYLSPSSEISDICKEDLVQCYLQHCDGLKRMERDMVGKF